MFVLNGQKMNSKQVNNQNMSPNFSDRSHPNVSVYTLRPKCVLVYSEVLLLTYSLLPMSKHQSTVKPR